MSYLNPGCFLSMNIFFTGPNMLMGVFDRTDFKTFWCGPNVSMDVSYWTKCPLILSCT